MLKRGIWILGLIILAITLAGCFQGEQSLEEMDPPQDAEAVDNLDGLKTEENDEANDDADENMEDSDQTAETIPRELYLIDANGLVAAQTLELPAPESNEVAQQVLEHLVKGGPVTPMLPNGFQAVLPEGTEVLGVNLQEDGIMVVDFSNEFADYEAEDEIKIVESVTYTLTQFENVHEVQLQMNGHPLREMPVNGTPIGESYSRGNGINVMDTDLNIMNSQAVTMYYPAEHNENRYYVPVTQYVKDEGENKYTSIVQGLLEGPGLQSNVIHVFNAETMLTNEPSLEDGVLDLTFSEEILQDREQSIISDEVMETIVRTLTENQEIEAINVNVENVEQLVNENGEAYNEPVTNQYFLPPQEV
ncbi:GerMN domain-containing protein [Virgibacillus sp. YIM 98842]|uniref:GerMN domain-containing protein n=1 Tax=Virgibacillus sp. YIM 98842 TaxID=2663533 RepID=UPI0013D9E01E|nr:GerMN domain-containing protein [Virgibacillus sp. YIM 98842]